MQRKLLLLSSTRRNLTFVSIDFNDVNFLLRISIHYEQEFNISERFMLGSERKKQEMVKKT